MGKWCSFTPPDGDCSLSSQCTDDKSSLSSFSSVANSSTLLSTDVHNFVRYCILGLVLEPALALQATAKNNNLANATVTQTELYTLDFKISKIHDFFFKNCLFRSRVINKQHANIRTIILVLNIRRNL